MPSQKPVQPAFDDISVSTKTVIAKTNATYNIDRLFVSLPIVNYVPQKGVSPNLPSGSIVTLKYFENMRGVDVKKRRGKGKFFRNALSVVMVVDNKLVNFKLSKNGKFQMTGIRTDDHAVECVKTMWKYILDLEDYSLYTLDGKELIVTVKVVMTNIDFSLGFCVNRENLDAYFNANTPYHSLLETSFGYTGVNIKFPCTIDLNSPMRQYKMNVENGDWTRQDTTYAGYLETLTPKEHEKEVTKIRYNTFLVFHSGNVIMSGSSSPHMRGAYKTFLEIISRCKSDIMEVLNEVR